MNNDDSIEIRSSNSNNVENSNTQSNGSSVDTKTIVRDEEEENGGSSEGNGSGDDSELKVVVEAIYEDLVDDVMFGLVLQTHRAAKLGYLHYVDPDSDPEMDKQFEIYDDSDVLGVFRTSNENMSNKSSGYKNGQNSQSALLKYECVCPNCERSLAAIRFAPHLEKCMGMGRNSSRIATRRMANGGGSGSTMTDYELDQLLESTGIIPNPRYFEQFKTQPQPAAAAPPPHSSSESDLMSIINSVATTSTTSAATAHPSSSCSSLIEVEVSSSSSNCSIHNMGIAAHSSSLSNNSIHHHHHTEQFKLPVAKKKKVSGKSASARSQPTLQPPAQPPPPPQPPTPNSASSSTTSTNSSRLNIC